MNYRYFLFLLFVSSIFFIFPGTTNAFMASTACSGPWLGSQLIPSNLYANNQFYCPFDTSGGGLDYTCTEYPDLTRSCVLTANSSLKYNCTSTVSTGSSWLYTGCMGGDTTPPSFPPNQKAVGGFNQMDIYWDYSTDVDDPVAKYLVYELWPSNILIATVPHTGNISYQYSYSGLNAGQIYYYAVIACDTVNNCTGVQGQISATTSTVPPDSIPPSTPVNLTATAVSSSQINLSWTASTDNIKVAGYRVYRNGVVIAPNVTATAYSDTGVSPSTAYTYTVDAYDAIPNYSGQSAPASATTPAAPDTSSPSAIINLSASNPTFNSMALSWTAPGDDGNAGTATVYDLRYSASPITSANWASAAPAIGEPAPLAAGTSQSMTVSGLNPSTAYYFAIKTRDEVGNESLLSNISSGTTAAIPDTAPPIFTFTSPSSVLPAGTTSATLSGTASDASEPIVCRFASAPAPAFDSMTALPLVGGVYTTAISGLTDGSAYTYSVKCRDSAGAPNTSNDFTLMFSVDNPIVDLTPPVISSGQPSTGTIIPANTAIATMSVRTDKPAYCSYAKDTDISYGAMTNALTGDLAQTYHSIDLTGLANGASYLYYVRCQGANNGVENASGYPISFSINMPSNNLPIAAINASPISGDAPLAVTADGGGSYDTDGAIARYTWQWGDSTADASGSNASHTYTTVGTYTLTLTVVDNQGGKGVANQIITATAPFVSPPPPQTTGFCALTCITNADCTQLNEVCAPNGICALPAGFCVPGAVGVCSNNTDCPDTGICPAPIIKDSYFTLPATNATSSSPAIFPAGTTDLIMSVETDVKAQCRYSATPSAADINFYNNTEFMRDFTYSNATSSSVALVISKNTASTTANYYIRCKDAQTGDMNVVDYPMSFTVGAQTLISGPAPFICWINQNFIKSGVPYLFDVCRDKTN